MIDFEDVTPTLFSGTTISSGGFDFASDGFGFSGVDDAAAFVFGNAPANAAGRFLFMLNNDGITMSRSGGAPFLLTAFRASFIAPLGGLGAGIEPGELLLQGDTGSEIIYETFAFSASDASGNFNFETFFTSALSSKPLLSVGFFACIFDSTGICSFDSADVPAQFALDDIAVPEPASLLLVMLALGIAGACARRRTS